MGMSEKEKKILEEVEYFKDRYFAFDEPVPFCGLNLYPVPTRYYNEFLSTSACLTLNKNDDPNGITKTHLEYLLGKMNDEKEGPLWSFKFSRLLELVFHIKNGLKCNKCGKYMSYEDFIQRSQTITITNESDKKKLLLCDEEGCDGVFEEIIKYGKDEETKKTILIVDGHKINSEDFMRFRRFVLYQNLPDYKDDSWVHREVREDQAAKQELLSRNSGTASLERKMICIAAKTNYKIDEIKDMPMRKMIQLLDIVQDVLEYQITKTGLMSGMVSLKKGESIEHWIYKKEKGLYGSAVDANTYTSQIKNA